MSDVRPADASQSTFRTAVERFEQAWQSGAVPSLDDYLVGASSASGSGAAVELARELVLIDLEFRWRKLRDGGLAAEPAAALPALPRAEDYLRRYPHVFADAAGEAELVAEEFLVRHRWGDRPPLSELVQRFPNRVDVVRSAERALQAVDQKTTAYRSDVMTAGGHGAEPTDVAPAVGTLWGRYVVAQAVGAGNFGSVFRCYDPQLNRFVALKVVRVATHGDDRRAAALHEARTAAAIRHPNVVTVFDVIENERDEIGIVTEFVAGEGLDKHLLRGEPDLFDALRWTADVADAVHEAHAVGIVHRDLKPTNILIDAAGRPRVTDFGLALLLTERAAAVGEVAGTPRYMSPEQLRGATKILDGRSDVWSLGVILYQLLCGRAPFPEHDAERLFHSIAHDAPVPLRTWNPRVPPQLEAACLRCLAKDPRHRWSTAHELAEALRNIEQTIGRTVGGEPAGDASPAAGASAQGWSSTTRRTGGNLPRTASPIIGRTDELARIEQALAAPDAWLVTVAGPGGVGKTRLALEAARTLKPPPGGVWWVDCAAARSAASACQAVLAGLHSGVAEQTALDEHVSQVLGCLPPLVLVLDNVEQCLDAAAELLRGWSERHPHVRFLVTSRERLRLPGERLIELEPLPVPADDADPATVESVQLFVRRAGDLQPDLQWDAEQLRQIGAICRDLEGMPLAIELAARRANVLSLTEIAAALRGQLLSFKAGPHERPDRQQTLLAAVAWSFDLLTPQERTVLVLMSRLVGGFTRETAAALFAALPGCGDYDLTELVQSLREKSLLRVRRTGSGYRFAMFEMIRAYAERLRPTAVDADTAAAFDEVLAATLPRQLAALRDRLTTADAAPVLERFADESENLGVIERWAVAAGRPGAALAALLPLVDAVPLRGAAPDLVDRLRRAIDPLAADDPSAAAVGRTALARLLRFEGRWREALDEARGAATDGAVAGEALRVTAEMQRRLGAPHEAEATLRRVEEIAAAQAPAEQALCHVEWAVLLGQRGALSQAQERLDRAASAVAGGVAPPLEAEIERRRGQLLLQAGRPSEALQHLESAAAAARTAGNLRSLQLALAARGAVSVDLGRYEQALADFAEAERLARRLGDRRGLAVVWGNRAIALADIGDRVAALESFRRAEQLNRVIDAKYGVAANLAGQANVYAAEGQTDEAAAAFDAALAAAESSDFEFLAAVIQGDRGVAAFNRGDFSAACDDLARALARLDAVGSHNTQEAFCYAAFASAANAELGRVAESAASVDRARALVAGGVVGRDHPKPRVQHAFQLLG